MKRLLLVIICIAFLFSGCTTAAAQGEGSSIPEAPLARTLMPVGFAAVPAASAPAALDETQPDSGPQSIKISAVGDLMCLYAQLSAARENGVYGFDYCYNEVKSRITGADIAIGNLETLIAKGHPYTARHYTGNPKINGPETFLSAAAGCGFDVLVNANNHIFDYKYDGINKTLQKVEEYGFLHTGAYAQGEERKQLVIDVKGIKIAVLAYADHINNRPRNVEGVNVYKESLVKSDIAEAKSAGAEFIIVYIHWGKERTHRVTSAQKKAAKAIAEAGADIILGSHPHCTQGTALINTDHGPVPVFYSLGNFLSSMGATICKDSIIVNMTLEKDGQTGETKLSSLTYTPTFCTAFSGRRFVILPADLSYIAQSGKAKILKASRTRTIRVLGTKVAQPL